MPQTLSNVILDRDGTVIEEAHYLSSPTGVRLLPAACPALKRLQDAGCRLYLLSNQSGVGRGYFSRARHERVQARVRELLRGCGVRLRAERFCFHAPGEGCSCRKPAPGLWHDLAAAEGLAAGQSVMIGDKPEDLRLAEAAGLAASILVLTGYGRAFAREAGLPEPESGWEEPRGRAGPGVPTVVASDLQAAAAWILGDGRSGLTGSCTNQE